MTWWSRSRPRHPALVALALLLAACGEVATSAPATPPRSEPAASAPSQLVSPQPSEQPSASDRAVATAVSGLEGAALSGVTETAGGALVAVGSVDAEAAAWTSSDGADWLPADLASDPTPGPFRAVAAGDDGLLAFAGPDDEVSTVWTSDDGGAWSRVAASGLAARVNAATFSDGRWLAAGDLIAEGGPADGGEALGGAVYSSADGRSWQIVTDELLTTEGTVSDLAATARGVAVTGFDGDGGVVWLDPATRLDPVTEGLRGATVQGIAPAGPGLVALGRGIADLRPVAWTSADGATWERVELDVAVFSPGAQIHDLSAWDGRLIAVGASPEGGAVWTSADGRTWSRGT